MGLPLHYRIDFDLDTCTYMHSHCVICTVASLVCSLHANCIRLWCACMQNLNLHRSLFQIPALCPGVLTTTIFITIIAMLIIILHSPPKTRTATFQSTHPNPWCSWQIPTRCQGSSNIQTYFIPWLLHRCFSYFLFHILSFHISYYLISKAPLIYKPISFDD